MESRSKAVGRVKGKGEVSGVYQSILWAWLAECNKPIGLKFNVKNGHYQSKEFVSDHASFVSDQGGYVDYLMGAVKRLLITFSLMEQYLNQCPLIKQVLAVRLK